MILLCNMKRGLFVMSNRIRLKLCPYHSALIAKKHDWRICPSEDEVLRLKKNFPTARHTIEKLLQPQVKFNRVLYEPSILFDRTRYTKLWRCTIRIQWPQPFHVVSVAEDPAVAENNCYLQACCMFQDLGVLNKHGDIWDFKKNLLAFQEHYVLKVNDLREQAMQFNSVRQRLNRRWVWTCHLISCWPFQVESWGQGLTQSVAENTAAAHVFIKLKALKLLSRCSTGGYQLKLANSGIITDPAKAFKIYVDASPIGFGAYLVPCETSPLGSKGVQWMSTEWKQICQKSDQWSMSDSTFLEYCALLEAVYTWKKDIANQEVIAYCDNNSVVSFVTQGMNVKYSACNGMNKTDTNRLFQVLNFCCLKYRITLHAVHIPREENHPADCLSRLKIEEFQKLVPTAMKKMKKPKKLDFFKMFNQVPYKKIKNS